MTEPTQSEPGMEKRFLLAVGLSVLILLGWQWLRPKEPVPPPPAPASETAPPAATEPAAPAPAPTSEPTSSAPPPESPARQAAAAETVDVAGSDFDARLTNEGGGRVVSWKLRGFRSEENGAVELVPETARASNHLSLAFDLDDRALTDRLNAALFQVERDAGDVGERVTFTWSDGAGVDARKSLFFRKDSPLVDVEVGVRDRGRDLPVRLTWGPGIEADDAASGGYIHYTGQALVRTQSPLPTRLKRGSVKASEPFVVAAAPGAEWAGLEEQYFAALLIPENGGEVVVRHAALPKKDDPKSEEDEVVAAVAFPEGKGHLYVGPKRYSTLRALGYHLEDAVWFSSYSLIYFFAKYLFLALEWIHIHVVSNWGMAIILATVALRLLLFPLNQYSMVKMRKTGMEMKRIQPKVKALQAKWKKSKDPQARVKLNEEMMALYKKEGVNPFGGVSGCLPMFLQFPILYAFYNVLTATVEMRGAPFFGWIADLTQKDPFYITPIAMGVTMFVQQKMNPATGMDPAQQRMMLFMPIVFTVMFINLPSGLVLYWFVNNLLGIGQQWLVNRHVSKLDTVESKA